MKPIIYQLVVRYFGNINVTNQKNGSLTTNGCGKFTDISTVALQSLHQLGVTHVWLTGCLCQATLTDYSSQGMPADDPDVVKGIAGSFYSIRDYFDVCPDYTVDPADRMTEFEELIARIHAAGLKCLIDFVPNHVARGYESVVRPDLNFGDGDDTSAFFKRDNHFFYLVEPPGQKLRLSKPSHWNPSGVAFDGEFAREDGDLGQPPKATGNNGFGVTLGDNDWYDTIKLNYGFNFVDGSCQFSPRPRTWELMNKVIAYWQAKGVDGFRCDFAHYVPDEFWTWLISEARQRDPVSFFIAEAYPDKNSKDPVKDMQEFINAGFDAVYHDAAYDTLKQIYRVKVSQDDYDREMRSPPVARQHLVEYLENHDERRIASPIVSSDGPDGSGFGSAEAGYQLAPLQFLYSRGPVLLLNGQEVGEPGAGEEGYNTDDGRTTFFDYWTMPEFVGWVNGHAYDGGGLSDAQKNLRKFYSALLGLCQDTSVQGDGYWGLKYFNRPDKFPDCPSDLYSFARFENNSGRVLIVVANFRTNSNGLDGCIRIPPELASEARLNGNVTVHLVLDRQGQQDVLVASLTVEQLKDQGFPVLIPNQSAHVYVLAVGK
ncbi:MAG: alpha-amylase [Microcystis aeruginosa Ma_QC_Ca_00000000_S207]|uniref:Alpha-amylase n=1 Tax=Microcystis aeruginosa Ma_QC_Ca_00000000_S207 TaxID=2486251 RepID=A0A552FP37_MICAE|nr:MAG: alpha-amylase [Microcystis aeruginosa Ma_QC_Ca_00000000_S207]